MGNQDGAFCFQSLSLSPQPFSFSSPTAEHCGMSLGSTRRDPGITVTQVSSLSRLFTLLPSPGSDFLLLLREFSHHVFWILALW